MTGFCIGVTITALFVALAWFLSLPENEKDDVLQGLRDFIPGLLFIAGLKLMSLRGRRDIVHGIMNRHNFRGLGREMYKHSDGRWYNSPHW